MEGSICIVLTSQSRSLISKGLKSMIIIFSSESEIDWTVALNSYVLESWKSKKSKQNIKLKI